MRGTEAIATQPRPSLGGRRMYYACVPNVQVRDVPEEVHDALMHRAQLAGQSLQQFLSAQLQRSR